MQQLKPDGLTWKSSTNGSNRQGCTKKVCLSLLILFIPVKQGCGAETIFFRSGSDFQKVSAPEPAPALT
jgi:hypothetical protein